MEEQTDEIKITEIGMDVIYQQDKAVIDTMIATAKAFPRSIMRSTENSIAIVTMDKETATTCNYAVPRGGKTITGPSVHLAKILSQQWGNMRMETKVIEIGQKHITSQAIAFDLEANIAIKVEVKRSIMTKTGRMNDDMITVTGNAANSISLRNAILSIIPRGVVNKVYNAALGKIVGDVSDENKLIARRKQVLEGLIEAYKVTEDEILASIGKASSKHLTGEDLAVLIGIGQAIKDGDTTVELAFKSKNTAKKTVDQQEGDRLTLLINEAPSVEVLESYKEKVKPEQVDLFNQKMEQLKTGTGTGKAGKK